MDGRRYEERLAPRLPLRVGVEFSLNDHPCFRRSQAWGLRNPRTRAGFACTSRKQRSRGLLSNKAVPPAALYNRSTACAEASAAFAAASRAIARCLNVGVRPAAASSQISCIASSRKARPDRRCASARPRSDCAIDFSRNRLAEPIGVLPSARSVNALIAARAIPGLTQGSEAAKVVICGIA